MIVVIETKAKPCPGVEQAIAMTEDVLRRGEVLYTVGQLIHNEREIERLEGMGLHLTTMDQLVDLHRQDVLDGAHFLVRTHGEPEQVLKTARACGLHVVDTTCPIVRHSQTLVEQHVREGWGIIIVGNEAHAEVKGLMERAQGSGAVISSIEDAEKGEFEDRSLLLAQTTIDPDFFGDVRKSLSHRLSGLKIVDTTCRFLRNRQGDVRKFGSAHDVVLLVGGTHSANCALLHKTVLEVNPSSYKVGNPENVEKKWVKNADSVGITGGASTPRWQLDEMKSFLENHAIEKNPKGLKNRKGGPFPWWKRKNKN